MLQFLNDDPRREEELPSTTSRNFSSPDFCAFFLSRVRVANLFSARGREKDEKKV